VRKKTHKYGIEVPTGLVRAKELDRINGNTLWMDALKLEMHNVGVAFEVLEDSKSAPQGWTRASHHIIWDLKMDFTRKARWVLDGHKLPTPEGSTYSGVLSLMCENSTDLCGAKWTGSMCCEHQECLSASAFLL
jgi:hypothetical protein